MRYYTFWIAYTSDMENTTLLTDEKPLLTKAAAFKRAHELLKDFTKGFGKVLLVRRISPNSDVCREWIFDEKA